ncbi:MAG: hypothetical protein CEO40_295, partial [Parcubacteria group bacterium LiPW_72]
AKIKTYRLFTKQPFLLQLPDFGCKCFRARCRILTKYGFLPPASPEAKRWRARRPFIAMLDLQTTFSLEICQFRNEKLFRKRSYD